MTKCMHDAQAESGLLFDFLFYFFAFLFLRHIHMYLCRRRRLFSRQKTQEKRRIHIHWEELKGVSWGKRRRGGGNACNNAIFFCHFSNHDYRPLSTREFMPSWKVTSNRMAPREHTQRHYTFTKRRNRKRKIVHWLLCTQKLQLLISLSLSPPSSSLSTYTAKQHSSFVSRRHK